jgi:outer membrane protein insertion porin family/translocation and assembly module TamA
MHRRIASAITAFGGALCTIILAASASAQEVNCDAGDKEVRKLSFTGNTAFTDAELSKIIVTTASPFARTVLHLPYSARRCLDRNELPKDRARLVIFYRRRGYSDATVDTVVRASGGGVEVNFQIREGLPTRLQSLVIQGLDSVPNRAAILRRLPIRAGQRFDRINLDAARDSIARRLRNSGYPGAEVNNTFDVNDSLRLAYDTISVVTGPFTRIGAVKIGVVPFDGKSQQVPDRIVRKIIGLDSGRVYREDDLLDAQRTLYRTEAYQHVSIIPDTVAGPTDSIADINALLAENTTKSARVGAGYGTLDCFRVTGELSNYNFLHAARRIDLTTRLSKIGRGDPLSGLDRLCPQRESQLLHWRHAEAAPVFGTALSSDNYPLQRARFGVQRVSAHDDDRRYRIDRLAQMENGADHVRVCARSRSHRGAARLVLRRIQRLRPRDSRAASGEPATCGNQRCDVP